MDVRPTRDPLCCSTSGQPVCESRFEEFYLLPFRSADALAPKHMNARVALSSILSLSRTAPSPPQATFWLPPTLNRLTRPSFELSMGPVSLSRCPANIQRMAISPTGCFVSFLSFLLKDVDRSLVVIAVDPSF